MRPGPREGARATVDGWIAIHDRKLQQTLAQDEVDRTRVERTLAILEQLAKGRKKLTSCTDERVIGAEISCLRMVHLGIQR